MNRKIYKVIGIAGLILYVIFVVSVQLKEAIEFAYSHILWEDEFSLYEKRFDKIKMTIPDNVLVGYFSEYTTTYGHDLAQYALAPRIVLNNTNQVYVVVDFKRKLGISKDELLKNYKIIKNCGNGVALFKRAVK
jgi:hypothetical protein